MKILIVPGHGDGDPGACALGYKEEVLTREQAKLLKEALSSYAEVEIFDSTKNLYKYIKAGNSFNFKKYDYVLELHFNAGVGDLKGNSKTTGTEILVHNTEKGVGVEAAIIKNISALGFRSRGIKVRTDLQNMNICKGIQGVSYALIETCFIDDVDDMNLYKSKKEAVVSAIAKSIIAGFGLMYTESKLMTSASDIAQALNRSYFPITEMTNFVTELEKAKNNNSPLYWGYYKLVNKIN